MTEGRDLTWDAVVKGQADTCDPVAVGAEHPLFILYTSGSTGKPKGVQHSSAGYLLHAMVTMKWVFDIHDKDTFWCTADIGWVTGHTYIAYGPLACGATQVVFEGIPTYPNPGRFWETIDKHKVSIFYTAPTAIRGAGQGGRGLAGSPSAQVRSLVAQAAGHGRRADQPRSLDVVPHQCRPRALPDRRHMVADRNRRTHDHAAARRARAQARLVHDAATGHRREDRRRDRPRGREGQGWLPCREQAVAGHDPHDLG